MCVCTVIPVYILCVCVFACMHLSTDRYLCMHQVCVHTQMLVHKHIHTPDSPVYFMYIDTYTEKCVLVGHIYGHANTCTHFFYYLFLSPFAYTFPILSSPPPTVV